MNGLHNWCNWQANVAIQLGGVDAPNRSLELRNSCPKLSWYSFIQLANRMSRPYCVPAPSWS